MTIARAEEVIQSQHLKLAATRTNIIEKDGEKTIYVPRSTNIGAYTTRGIGITQDTFKSMEFLSAIHSLAKDREKTHANEDLGYLAAQVTRLKPGERLKAHQDLNNGEHLT
eukprot:2976439-Amphidinium_carterae.1